MCPLHRNRLPSSCDEINSTVAQNVNYTTAIYICLLGSKENKNKEELKNGALSLIPYKN